MRGREREEKRERERKREGRERAREREKDRDLERTHFFPFFLKIAQQDSDREGVERVCVERERRERV